MENNQRYDIFKRTHKGIRNFLFQTGTRIQQTDFTDKNQVSDTIMLVRTAVHTFLYHLEKENSVIYQSVIMKAPYVISMLEQSNRKDADLGKKLEQMIRRSGKLNSSHEQTAFGLQLQAFFFEFTSAVLQHMNKEEHVINDLLWSSFSDAEIASLELEMIRQAGIETGNWYAYSIMKGLSDDEIAEWIGKITEAGSELMAERLISTARSVLNTQRWQMISNKFPVTVEAA